MAERLHPRRTVAFGGLGDLLGAAETLDGAYADLNQPLNPDELENTPAMQVMPDPDVSTYRTR